MKRFFTDFLPSEKSAILAERYEKVMCQNKRNVILDEHGGKIKNAQATELHNATGS